jgi:serine dehydrogenase proteinase
MNFISKRLIDDRESVCAWDGPFYIEGPPGKISYIMSAKNPEGRGRPPRGLRGDIESPIKYERIEAARLNLGRRHDDRPRAEFAPAQAGDPVLRGDQSKRASLVREIEKVRGSVVICFLTSLRHGACGVMTDDTVRVFLDHMARFKKRPVEKLDIFLCSNGGSGAVPWRLISLFREFARSFNVLLPYRAYSAATLLALGADEIVMHPFAEMGPIDPTVTNDYNPIEHATGKKLGISVEDVTAYINFVKSTVGITHEDELVKAVEILAQKVHPLALGNVERFLAQSRLIAKKALNTHMGGRDTHAVAAIVENLASKLYFRGHPINRHEARDELHLKVNLDLPEELERAMWTLYLEFETLFDNRLPFDPAADLEREGLVVKEYDTLQTIIESAGLSSAFRTRKRYSRTDKGLREHLISQGWSDNKT